MILRILVPQLPPSSLSGIHTVCSSLGCSGMCVLHCQHWRLTQADGHEDHAVVVTHMRILLRVFRVTALTRCFVKIGGSLHSHELVAAVGSAERPPEADCRGRQPCLQCLPSRARGSEREIRIRKRRLLHRGSLQRAVERERERERGEEERERESCRDVSGER